MRRFVAISAAVAVISLVPYGCDQFLLDVPLALRLALLPLCEGLRYMGVAFHESGHAITYWLFGRPAFPTFDTVHGGGTTYALGRSMALTAGVYALMAALAFILVRKKHLRALAALGVFAVLHFILLLRGWDAALGTFMGHGTEVLAACWCMLRAFSDKPLSKAERYVSLIAGIHLAGRVALLTAALLLHDMRRLAYSMQKGEQGSADLDKLAWRLGIATPEAVSLLAGFLYLCLAITGFILYKRLHKKGLILP